MFHKHKNRQHSQRPKQPRPPRLTSRQLLSQCLQSEYPSREQEAPSLKRMG